MKSTQSTSVPALTPLLQAAIATFEMFTAYVEAGFTREEALQLVIGVTRADARQP